MTELTSSFEKYFMPLAQHHDIKFRDHIATEANFQECQPVLDEVLKYGVSEDVLEKLKG
jgi:hypothetical protein